MAGLWEPKSPSEVIERRWTVPLDLHDGISSVSAEGTGVTVSRTDHYNKEAIVSLSGGSAGTVATVAVTVVTDGGETFTETFLIAVRADAEQFAYTARDICYFALRKLCGLGVDPTAEEANDALERLNDMLAMWRIDGLDLGLPVLALGTVLDCPDEFIAPIKFNLRIACHSALGEEVDAYDLTMAQDGKRLIGNKINGLRDVQIPQTLTCPIDTVADLF